MNLRSSCYYEARTPKMPVGLVELMEDLSKDVLKNNPTDIYSFCANHMKKLLIIREGSKSKKTPNIDQKIEIAKMKVRERAALRCKNFDKNFAEMANNTNYLKEPTQGSDMNAEEYVQERVVKILENDLEDNEEHGITAAFDEENLKSQTVSSNPAITEITNKCLDKNEDNLKTISAQFSDQVLESSISQADMHINKYNKSIFISEENVTNEITNVNVNAGKNDKTVLFSEVLTKTREMNKSEDNKKVLQLKVENDKCDNSENDYINQEEDNNTLKDDEMEYLDSSKIDVNRIGTEELKEINHENLTDFKNDSISDSLASDNDDSNKETKSSEEKNSETNDGEQFKDDSSKMENSDTRNHINNHSMDLETAAITIQKVFRSFLFRNKTQSLEDVTNIDVNLLIADKQNKHDNEESHINKVKDRRTLGINRMDTVLQTVNEEKSLSLSTDDSSTISSAATIIQAHVRGFLVRNKLNTNKTTSSTSGIDSDAQSFTSLEGDNDNHKNKTILNIHIVPETGNFMSRDESMLASIDLSLDGSPPGSTNLHPLGYDKSERRKLKREDAIQSISPPSNNSGKLSEDIDSVKEIIINNDSNDQQGVKTDTITDKNIYSTNVMNYENITTMVDDVKIEEEQLVKSDDSMNLKRLSTLIEMTSDEMDVITPSTNVQDHTTESESDIKLLHSGECHDIVLPTKVSRSDASIVRGE